MDSAAAGEKPKAKRGRKQDNTLPPSRSRDMQRAFRARKAEHLAQLEAKVVRLEGENNELRAQLGMAARPPTPPPSAEGGANPSAAARGASPSESVSSVNGKTEEGDTPSNIGGGEGGRSSSQSPAPSVSPGWRPTPLELPPPPPQQQQQLPSPNNYRPYSNGAPPPQWGGPAGYPQQQQQPDLAMLADLATHPRPYPPPPPGPYPVQPHPSHYDQSNYSYPQPTYPQQHSVLPYPPSQASPSFPYSTNRLPPLSTMHHGSPTDAGSPSSFRPSHQASFTRSEPVNTPTPPPNPCRPDSRACPPAACAPAQNGSEATKASCGPSSKGCGPTKGECGPLQPISSSLAPPAARGPLPSIQSIFDASGQPNNLPDLDLSPLAALGTYIRPHPLRPPSPDRTLVDRFLETYTRLASTAPGAPPSSSTPPSPAYRLFLVTLLGGLELTGKGPCERESFTPEEEMQLNTPPGEECCGGIVDCTGSLFEEQVFYDAEGRSMMKDGWLSCSAAWEALAEFCDEDGVEVKQEDGAEEERDHKRHRSSFDSPSSSSRGRHSPSFLAHCVLENSSPTSTFASTRRTDTLVSRNVRCEATLGFMVKDSAVMGVKNQLAKGETNDALEMGGNVKTEPQQYQLQPSFQQRPSPHALKPSFSPPPLQQTNGCGPAPRKACC